MSEKARLSRTNRKQFEELLNFISSHPCLLRGKNKPGEAQTIEKLWDQFASEINRQNIGPYKTSKQWKKIFAEWKVNTKRKSREIELSRTATGGGLHTNKTLTDLEEKLLSLISTIHLGEKSLPDSLGGRVTNQEDSHPLQVEEDATQNVVNVVEYWHEADTSEPNLVDEGDKIPKIPKEIKQTKVSNRYTAEILKEACEQFANAQTVQLQSITRNESLLENLTVCLNGIGNSLDEISRAQVLNAEANIIRARAEELKARVQFLKFIKETEGSE